MKKYNVHVILGDKFHSVVIECDGFFKGDGYYSFYRRKGNIPKPEPNTEEFSWYPISQTIIEEYKELNKPNGSGGIK